MRTFDKVGATVGVLLLIALIGGCAYTTCTDWIAESDVKRACWECGWGRAVKVYNDWRCYGHDEFGAEVVRSVEWVQENDCIGE